MQRRHQHHREAQASAQPARLKPDKAVDNIVRIEDVQFNPWWSLEPKLFGWRQQNGEAFIFGRPDWEHVFNTFNLWLEDAVNSTYRDLCQTRKTRLAELPSHETKHE
jgi:hypothetical protein